MEIAIQKLALICILSFPALTISALGVAFAAAAEKSTLPTAQTTRNIEGWTVRVDDRLLKGEHAAAGVRALKLLEARLVAITVVVPEKSLAKLRTISIQLDQSHGVQMISTRSSQGNSKRANQRSLR